MNAWHWVAIAIGWLIMAGITGTLASTDFVQEYFVLDEESAFQLSVIVWPFFLFFFSVAAILFGSLAIVKALGRALELVFTGDVFVGIQLWRERRQERAVRRLLAQYPTIREVDPFLEQARREVEQIAPEES